jgi:DNA-binding transcriptional ArsR family regulator
VDKIGFQDTLSVLSNSISRSILDLLKTEKMSAGEIAEKLHMTPAATSYHLAKLKKAELIYETKYKNFIYYEIDLSVLDDVVLWINNLKGEKQK